MATCSPTEDIEIQETVPATTKTKDCTSETELHLNVPSNSPKICLDEDGIKPSESNFRTSLTPQILRKKIKSRRKILTPNQDYEEIDDCEEYATKLPHIFISNKTISCEEQVSLFCDQMIGQCLAEDVDEAISLYLLEKLACKRSWTAVWKTAPEVLLENCDIGDLPFVGVHVEVNCTPCEGHILPLRVSVSVAEPFSANIANLPRQLVEDVLREQDYSVPVLDVYPIQGLGTEVDVIAEALEHARFFYDFLWRDWDDEEECDEYAGLIEKRIQLYCDIQDGTIPGPVSERYRKTLEDYRSKRLELTKFQTNIRGEALPGEAVECWKKYYEMLMLCGLLKGWEDMRLRSHGPFYPRIYKRRRGPRASGKPVTHIVAKMMTTDMIKNFPPEALIQQHDTLSAALDCSFSGDHVVVYPGTHQTLALAALADDITIRGEGDRKEIVLVSDQSQDNFVASKATRVVLSNLTLVQKGTCDGIVVVEAGEMTLDRCVLMCEGMGVRVLTGASLVMRHCEISGAQGAGVELYPGSVAELYGNNIFQCCNQASKGSQGAINLKVLPKPQLKMSENHIHDNQGYGVSILIPGGHAACEEGSEKTACGDQIETDHVAKALQELSLEMNSNKLESNTSGNIGLLRKAWASS